MRSATTTQPIASKPDPDSILDKVLRLMDADIDRLITAAQEQNRLLGLDEAKSAAGYARVLAAVVQSRKATKGPATGKSMAELLEIVKGMPEVKELFGAEDDE